MAELNVMDVYRKIKEIRESRKIDKQNPISIDSIVQAVDGNKDTIDVYIRALVILELIETIDKEHIIWIK